MVKIMFASLLNSVMQKPPKSFFP